MNRLHLMALVACAMIGAGALDARAAVPEHRIALVVGNAAYKNAPPLKNPVNDARDMGKALQEVGFDVIRIENATKQQLEHAIGQFSAKLAEGSVGLFFYSGHGIQANGHNYLIPVDAELASEAAMRIETTDVDLVLELMDMAKTRVNVVILDACRSNPFERRFRALGRGLAAVEQAPRGTLVAYSTAPGKVASDGDGANGLYTTELLRAIRQPGLKVEEVFKIVRIAVSKASNDSQTPWESSSLTGDFYFKPPAPVMAALPPPPPPAASPPPEAVDPEEADIAFWNSVKDEKFAAPYQEYLRAFPSGRFAGLARVKIAEFSKPPPPTSAPPPIISVQPAPTPAAPATTPSAPPPIVALAPTTAGAPDPISAQSNPPTPDRARSHGESAFLAPPAAPIPNGPHAELAFRCPRSGTTVQYDNSSGFTFAGENGLRCAYTDRSGARGEKIAGFAEDSTFLSAGLDRLWPLKVGAEQKFSVNIGGGNSAVERFAVLRRESVKVPAGTFDTFVVEQEENSPRDNGKRLFWFAPDLGIIVKSTFTQLGSRNWRDGFAGTGSLVPGDYEAVKITVPGGITKQ